LCSHTKSRLPIWLRRMDCCSQNDLVVLTNFNERNRPIPRKKNVSRFAADFMTTFYRAQIGARAARFSDQA
jgi:hypothetical protein